MNKIIFIVMFFLGLTHAILCMDKPKQPGFEKSTRKEPLYPPAYFPEFSQDSLDEKEKRLMAYVNEQYDLIMPASRAGLSGRFNKRQTNGSINSEYKPLAPDSKKE